MISGELYLADKVEPQFSPRPSRQLAHRINTCDPGDWRAITAMEKELFGSTGREVWVQPPVQVDYGFNTHLGENFYANFNTVFLDVAPIRIGDNVKFGPNCQLITATHPLDAGVRARGLEYGSPITIGDNVWLGAGVIVNPGVTIGDNAIIGSGAVVTKDIPANVIAVGNPARVLRELTDADTEHWETKERDYWIAHGTQVSTDNGHIGV